MEEGLGENRCLPPAEDLFGRSLRCSCGFHKVGEIIYYVMMSHCTMWIYLMNNIYLQNSGEN